MDEPVTTEAVEAPETPQTFDASGFEARMEELAGTVGQLVERIPEQPEIPDYEEEEVSPDQMTPQQRAEALIQQIVQTKLEEALAPTNDRLQGIERVNAIADIEQQYPNVTGATAEQVISTAEKLAKEGVFADPHDPRAIELAYLAGIGREAAQSEKPAGEAQVQSLESASAEAPNTPEAHPGDAIVAAGGQLPSWVNT